ncbi:MAG: peptide-N-glycosidase F-related protein [Bacteroidetes bacterium]|nr:peptide-N-glycosidase F-related protein [Bacteroidota bacterium]
MKALYQQIRLVFILVLFPFFLYSQSNQYLHFDKVDDFAILNGASQYVLNSTAITMTGWFYTDALGYGQGMFGLRSGGQGFYMIILNNGEIECRLRSSTGLYEYKAPANTIIPQMWQHFAWVYDGTSVTLYVNGFLKGTHTATGVINDAAVPFGIGKSLLSGYNFVYGGRIDEVSLWNTALSQTEIQDLMTNELTGTETGLQLYYKFNQGVPGGNNTSITKLISEVGGGQRDADLMNFAMNGATSNFNGTLNTGYQAISFPQIPNKLTTTPPFQITASATSGLPVSFEIVSGPATIANDMITLTGTEGDIVVKAIQNGNAQYDTASPVINSFSVIDPVTHTPVIDIRSPLAGDVNMPVLKKMQLAAISTITYPELFDVTGLYFVIDGVTIPSHSYANGHFTAWWTPPAYGTYSMAVVSANNYGSTATENVAFTIVPDTMDKEITAAQGLWLNTDVPSLTVESELPSFVGAFDRITATLSVSCPTGGCGEYDRIASVDAKGHDGVWHEIIHYITPYSKACSHNIDLTDYMSLLSGKIAFRFNCSTLDNGYIYKLDLHYSAGYPLHCYSSIYNIWKDYYPFGDYANLQPVEVKNFVFPDSIAAAKLKLVSTGHGWGSLNTSNAAEFYEATHHIWVNGAETFEQHNWYVCNPNPDGCQPQNGTWYYPRAGWCPGAIAQWFDYDMTPYISSGTAELRYVFFPDYLDLCHPNNPNCVTGVTCTDCSDGFNPALDVACNMVVFADAPIINSVPSQYDQSSNIRIYPNPGHGIVNLFSTKPGKYSSSTITITNPSGNVIKQISWDGKNTAIDLSGQAAGIYFIMVQSQEGIAMKKFILM